MLLLLLLLFLGLFLLLRNDVVSEDESGDFNAKLFRIILLFVGCSIYFRSTKVIKNYFYEIKRCFLNSLMIQIL